MTRTDVRQRVRPQTRPAHWPVLAAISAGGGLGGLGRYGISLALPGAPGGFPWATFAVNVTGCLLIGVLMVLVAERWPDRRLVRPFLGVGVLGGFTTFSVHVLEAQDLIGAGAAGTALAYLAGTVVAALAAVAVGVSATRWLVRR